MRGLSKIILSVLVIVAATSLLAIRVSAATDTSLTGVMGLTWGDSVQGEGIPPQVNLYDTEGNSYLLKVDDSTAAAAGGLLALNGMHVTVQGTFDASALDLNGNPAFVVSDIALTGEASALGTVIGSHPWVVIMCGFPDYPASPKNQAFFQGLFGSTFPGINDFWQRNSYGAVNINGTAVMPTWAVMPHPRSYYIGSSANLQSLTNDCTGLVDATVNFSQFSGVSMMFNAELDGYAWGGTTYLNRDGVGIIRATWMPPWGYTNQNVMAHEVGHGFGLPHSSGPYNQTYDSPWDVMSSWPPCNGHSDPNYGCIGVETISFHRNLLGWIPSNKIYTAGIGTSDQITLERLGQPTNPAGSYLMAIIPFPGSTTRFYTVEARKYIDTTNYDDYEEELIGKAVVIHLVDTTRSDRLAQVVDGDNNGNPKDAGTMWTPGETYIDSANKIYISVLSETTTGYVVSIRNGTTANDSFSTPTGISSFPFSDNINTQTATADASDPIFPCASAKGNATVWYKFTPNSPGPAQISTVGSNYDTLLAVWTGTSGSLTNVACDDNSGGNGTSTISTDLAAGKTYYIEVAAKTSAGNLNFNLAFSPCFTLSTTVSPAGSGVVTASPAPNCYGTFYSNGTTVQLTATPGNAQAFSGWSGSITGSANPASLTMSANRSVTAKFTPAPPTLVSPIGGTVVSELKPVLDWTDVSGASYQVRISKYSNLSSATSYSSNTSALTLSTNLLINTKYYWQVRSKIGSIYSGWSATGTFFTPNPPSIPILTSPGNGKSVPTYQPVLDWNDSTNNPTGYQIQLSAEKAFSAPFVDAKTTTSNYTVNSPLGPNIRYYWHVRSFNAQNQYSAWSSIFSFGTLPAAPHLVSPLGGAAVDTLRPKFDWDDAVGGAKSYTIQVAWDMAFSQLIKTATVSGTEFIPGTDLPRSSLLYWRVLSNGSYGKSAWSGVESLQSPNPPTIPSLLLPGNSKAVSSYKPAMDWSESLTPPAINPLPFTPAIGYQIQVSGSSTFASLVLDVKTGISTYAPTSDLPIGIYYWRVRAYNSLSQYSTWSSVFKFYTPGGVSGKILDAERGTPISGAAVSIVGTSLTTNTDSNGAYSLLGIPGGSRSIQVSSNNHVTLVTPISIANGAMVHFSAAQPSSGAAGSEYRIVLFWENGPSDLDLHLWLPSLTPAHIRWDNAGTIASFPRATLLKDSAISFGTETLRIDQLYAGSSIIGVYNYSNDAALRTAKAVIWIYKGDTLIKTIKSPGSGSYRWWRVFSMDGSGNISVTSSIVASAPGSYDKTGGTGPK